MKNIAIWGAASGLGAAIVEHFHQHDFQVLAIARNPDRNPRINQLDLTHFSCDATDEVQVRETVSKLPADTIHISTMGSFNADVPVDYIGHRHLVNALEEFGHRRMLLVTSLGCGDSWQYLSERSKKGFGAAVREKSLAEAWLMSSTLDFTIVRPGGLKDGQANGKGELSQNTEVHGLITRSEVARLCACLLEDSDSIGQIYQCVDPSMHY